jgi:membrane-associated protease RseP (regulator of RpoE activity)
LPDHQPPPLPRFPLEPGRIPPHDLSRSFEDVEGDVPGRHGALRPPRRTRPWVNVLLFLLTFVTTTWMGAMHYHGFLLDFVPRPLVFTTYQDLLIGGLWYSLPLLAFFGAHEMGHYLACRYYRVDATLPFFLPFIGLTGTLGAVIRIRSPIRTKPVLFDVGVAGPIAGFVVVVPLMIAGLWMSRVVPLPDNFVGLELGEPLLFQWVAWMLFGPIPEGHSLNLHPMAFAAWFGLLATAINLFPIGQLDGGHISYAVLGPKSTYVTLGAVGTAVLLTLVSLSWIVWSALMVLILIAFGPRHPATLDEQIPLDHRRLAVAGFAVLIFIACFTPAPIQPFELIRGR